MQQVIVQHAPIVPERYTIFTRKTNISNASKQIQSSSQHKQQLYVITGCIYGPIKSAPRRRAAMLLLRADWHICAFCRR